MANGKARIVDEDDVDVDVIVGGGGIVNKRGAGGGEELFTCFLIVA